MLFNSFEFALFLPIVFTIYWALPHKHRWFILLVSSYYFYLSWNLKYIVLILFTTIVSYLSGILLGKSQSKLKKKILLTTTLLTSLGILFFFKYFNFFSDSLGDIFNTFRINLHPITLKLLLPVGISFYTFQTLSYVIDVYRGDVEAEYHFGKYATFITFFPQLVAGPIERTRNLLPQINTRHKFEYTKATYGLKLMVWGLFKKVVIADSFALYVDKIYNDVFLYKGFSLIAATLFFTIQIYCDFSGYSDIAIGSANLFGIDLMTNFKSPYLSKSIKEFWSRWHISLSTWFKDYVYIPLGGNRCSKLRHNFNLIVTFLISGLWHGANWTYVIWGGIHGSIQVMENFFSKKDKKTKGNKISNLLSVLVVFVICNITWIFFRARNLKEVIYIFQNMFKGLSHPTSYLISGYLDLGLNIMNFYKIIIIFLILLIFDIFNIKSDVIQRLSSMSLIKRWFIYIFFVICIIFSIPSSSGQEFIYFQF